MKKKILMNKQWRTEIREKAKKTQGFTRDRLIKAFNVDSFFNFLFVRRRTFGSSLVLSELKLCKKRFIVFFSFSRQTDGEKFTSSFCSTHTLSLSCSPVEANRRIHAIHSHSLPQATPPPTVIGPLFSDIQREFQRKEMQEPEQQGVSTSCEPNVATLQVHCQSQLHAWCPSGVVFRSSFVFHIHVASCHIFKWKAELLWQILRLHFRFSWGGGQTDHVT